MSAYRADEYRELCAECRQPTDAACRGCARPQCTPHLRTHRLCPDCAGELAARLVELGPAPGGSWLSFPHLAVGIAALILGAVDGSTPLGVLGLALSVGAGAVSGSGPRHAWRLRHREILADMLDRS